MLDVLLRSKLKYFAFVLAFQGNSQLSRSEEIKLIDILPAVVVVDQVPPSYKSANFSEQLKDYISLKLGDFLSQNSSVFIKNYGKGQLQSISFRGTGASQTKIFWNGFVVNAPTLGQTDLSLYPTFFQDRITLNYGHSSMISGNGGLGGGIELTNELDWNRGLKVMLSHEFASFSNHTSTLMLNHVGKKGKLSQQLKFYRASGINDFKFDDVSKPDAPKVIQQNNEVEQEGFQYVLGLGNYRNNLTFKGGAFYFNSDRNLPSLIGSLIKNENQWDESFRGFGELNVRRLFTNKIQLNARCGYSKENMIYSDSSSSLVSKTQVESWQPQIKITYSPTYKMKLKTTVFGNLSHALSDGFQGQIVERQEYALLTQWEHKIRKFGYDVMIRQSSIDGEIMPFTFGNGVNYDLRKINSKVKFSFSRNFRYPTLNDLYWSPGGNIDLKPELSYTSDLGYLGYFFDYKLRLNFNMFYGLIDDWIQWVPSTGNFWNPQNIKKVENSGMELGASYFFDLPKESELQIITDYAYNNSITIKSDISNDQSIGKQLIYVPKHKLSFTGRLVTDYFSLSYDQSITSKVYIDGTNSIYLPGYLPANLLLSTKFLFSRYGLELNLGVNNIYNEPYQVVANRPIPGRNYSFTIRLGYN